MLTSIDLNCDMGELLPGKSTNFDQEIMPYITSCNVACGFHSGIPVIIENTIVSASAYTVKIGAHPSYNDREHFGRVSVDYDLNILLPELRYQICAVKGMVESMGGRLHHVKPHGALYNDMVQDEKLAQSVIQLVKSIDPSLKIYGLAHSQVIDICKSEDMQAVNEGFADRRYQKQQQLRSRTLDDAVIHETEDVLSQIDNFINGRVALYSKETSPISIESICLHSDTRGAVQLCQKIYQFIKDKDIAIG